MAYRASFVLASLVLALIHCGSDYGEATPSPDVVDGGGSSTSGEAGGASSGTVGTDAGPARIDLLLTSDRFIRAMAFRGDSIVVGGAGKSRIIPRAGGPVVESDHCANALSFASVDAQNLACLTEVGLELWLSSDEKKVVATSGLDIAVADKYLVMAQPSGVVSYVLPDLTGATALNTEKTTPAMVTASGGTNVFWIDEEARTVYGATLGSAHSSKPIATDLSAPHSVLIDGSLAIIAAGNQVLKVPSVSSPSGTPTILADNAKRPISLAQDATRYYWLEAETGALVTRKKDSGPPEQLAAGEGGLDDYAHLILVDGDDIYWMHPGQGTNTVRHTKAPK